MRTKIIAILFGIILISSIVGAVQTQNISKNINKYKPTQSFVDDAPIWDIDQTWTYTINNIDLVFDETEGRYAEIHITSGDFTLTVASVTSTLYRTEFTTNDLDVDLDFDTSFDADLTVKASGPATIIPNPAGTVYVKNNAAGETPVYQYWLLGT